MIASSMTLPRLSRTADERRRRVTPTLETKALKSGHLLDFDGREHLREQMDRPIVDGMTEEAMKALEEDLDGVT